jgi:hypothetical protein
MSVVVEKEEVAYDNSGNNDQQMYDNAQGTIRVNINKEIV